MKKMTTVKIYPKTAEECLGKVVYSAKTMFGLSGLLDNSGLLIHGVLVHSDRSTFLVGYEHLKDHDETHRWYIDFVPGSFWREIPEHVARWMKRIDP